MKIFIIFILAIIVPKQLNADVYVGVVTQTTEHGNFTLQVEERKRNGEPSYCERVKSIRYPSSLEIKSIQLVLMHGFGFQRYDGQVPIQGVTLASVQYFFVTYQDTKSGDSLITEQFPIDCEDISLIKWIRDSGK